ncbi:hypothetical protein IMCC3317_44300 [Kordia antarctica]|uniref:Uncharacterized protein n=1 Tax=Kordia antarctica TaxID=1218801 RepID=A0A7L4ZRD4_9FLAO|nr:hypothetical protein [Kordia antarctica]QHI39030.1 hypothetical protein IMCC3317_44300 [Kordia antarctica]
MANYYVNKNSQSNGDHEVHTSGCSWLPKEENRIYLGNFDNCKDAVKKAKGHYDKTNGCYYCANDCHTT